MKFDKTYVENHDGGYGNVELVVGNTGYTVYFTGIHGAPLVTKGKRWGSIQESMEDGEERDAVLAKAWEVFNASTPGLVATVP